MNIQFELAMAVVNSLNAKQGQSKLQLSESIWQHIGQETSDKIRSQKWRKAMEFSLSFLRWCHLLDEKSGEHSVTGRPIAVYRLTELCSRPILLSKFVQFRNKSKTKLIGQNTESLLNESEFETMFREQTQFVRKCLEPSLAEYSYIAVYAPPKSGKRIIKEVVAMRNIKYQCVYVTALNRLDIAPQIEEMENYGIKCCKIKSKDSCQDLINKVSQVKEHAQKEILLFIDEADYGAGIRQLMAEIIKYADNIKCKFIFITATPHEIYLSEFNNDNLIKLDYRPNDKYTESSKIVLVNNVVEAGPFWNFEKELPTPQGAEAIEYLLASGRPFGILRDVHTYRQLHNSIAFRDYLKQKKIKVRFVDQGSSASWDVDDFDENGFGGELSQFVDKEIRTLIVICQTCTRSTEIKEIRKYCAFLHEYRKNYVDGTVHQSIGRLLTYDPIEVEPIRVYSGKVCLKRLYDAIINGFENTLENNKSHKGKLANRTQSRIRTRGKWTLVHKDSVERKNAKQDRITSSNIFNKHIQNMEGYIDICQDILNGKTQTGGAHSFVIVKHPFEIGVGGKSELKGILTEKFPTFSQEKIEAIIKHRVSNYEAVISKYPELMGSDYGLMYKSEPQYEQQTTEKSLYQHIG